ncbi:MAG: DEAD/DEAH box helicase [Promethearchaeota archaeon]|nr:MAG: DEAD/DEAH box helicase [Candidatus Lokiarchaeota archaeon]
MALRDKLELIFIPSSYWNDPLSNFKLFSKENTLLKSSSFFFMWTKIKNSEGELNEHIKFAFPSIPSEKLVSCQINLAFPMENSDFFEVTTATGKIVPIIPMMRLLYTMELIDTTYEDKMGYSNSVKTWSFLAKFLFELLNQGQFVPKMEKYTSINHKSSWKPLLKSEIARSRFNSILNWSSWTSFCLPTDFIATNGAFKSKGLWHPSYLFSLFLDDVGDSVIRSILNQKDFLSFQEYYSSEIKSEAKKDFKPSWDYKFLKSLISKDGLYKIEGFHESILPNLVQSWTQSVQRTLFRQDFSIKLELKYHTGEENGWPLSIFLILGTKSLPLEKLWASKSIIHKELKDLGEKEGYYIEYILRALGRGVKVFPPIKRALESSLQSTIYLTTEEIMSFLKYPRDILIQSGFNIVLPDVFKRGGKQRLTSTILIRSRKSKKQPKGVYSALPSLFDINSMLEVNWEINIGEKKLSQDQIDQIITSNQPIINLDGEWILIEQEDLSELKTLEKPKIHTYMDALRLGMTGKIQSEQGNEYEVIIEGDFKRIVENILKIEKFESIPVSSLFNGNLRPYQKEGVNWIANLAKFNFGLCLADDMGLGKTIQVIAFLCHLKDLFPDNSGSYLIICPTSILFNWQRELAKFAPSLEVTLHHGPNRNRDLNKVHEFTKPHQIYLTSYGTIRNDIKILETIQFSGIIVDESQNIKNYYSQQTLAINRLRSQFRICLSGTPIENRLLELWSLFNFLNPGLLGNRRDFNEEYIIPIERFQDQKAIDKLKLIINPFILRRVKSDKSIIKDLPEKNEMKLYVELTEEQLKLYENLVENTLQKLELLMDDKRKDKGLILSLLVKLKQICNHPFQYLKKDIDSMNIKEDLKEIISKSKKLKRLIEMVDEIILNGEKVLIFTQFTQMGNILKKVLEYQFNLEILYFHGSIAENKRKEIVDQFQSTKVDSPPILILSLRAGGTGLNLTQGTTVIHYDRWWNPAVENQATDRAYRIGQKSVVNVYKFISKGTIEEKIDLLLEEKKDLADMIVSTSGEAWITDLDGEQLKKLFILSS